MDSDRSKAEARLARIEHTLRERFAPRELRVEDKSHKHRGHAGAADGAGHFAVRLVSDAFVGQNRLKRHRLVYDALRAEMGAEIHALSLDAKTPEEAAAQSSS